MTANGYLEAMRAIDITCSLSRSLVSNDNPVSESAFKTMKYQPDYPGKFNSIRHARQWCDEYYQWANNGELSPVVRKYFGYCSTTKYWSLTHRVIPRQPFLRRRPYR